MLKRYDTGHFDAVSITTTVNYPFGGGVVDEEYGIILNNEMNDFSVPDTKDALGNPPNPANFPAPGRRPLSSMSPIIVSSDENPIVIGGSGGKLLNRNMRTSIL